MSTQSWLRAKALFAAAQDQPAAQRDAWLRDQCADDAGLYAEVAALLAAQGQPDSLLDAGGQRLLAPLLGTADTDTARTGERIGAYRVLQLLGAGGMGSVYLAERADGGFGQQVALKLIRTAFDSPELRERFLRERAILARLQHPNIAHLHDGGVAGDGTPYFTLEYVRGEAITRWCDARALSVRARVALVLKVCAAVQYAHRNLIVHRDLKPANILVDAQGTPKLLDFGIAKLLDPSEAPRITGSQSQPMTREYAAPEQVLGEPVTTATDVYALGVLLYELLCGHLPYANAARGVSGWSKAILEDSPEPLSRAVSRDTGGDTDAAALSALRSVDPTALQRILRGDLERIVERALEKAPEARYASVDAFADDLRAWLDGRALPGGNRRYRLGKFLRRHWLPLSAAATVLLLVITGSVAVAWQARARAREAEHALREAATTAAVKEFLLGLFTGADPRANNGKIPSVRELLDKGAARIDHDLGAQPALAAELKAMLGGVYSRLGLYPQAIALQEQAIAGLDTTGSNAQLAARTVGELARAARANGDARRAEALLDEQIKRLDALPDAPVDEVVYALYLRTFVATDKHRFDEALGFAERAERIARAQAQLPGLLGDALSAKAAAYWGLHQYEAASAQLQQAIALHGSAGPAYRMSAYADRQTLALVDKETGRYAEAFTLDELVLDNARAVLGERHPYVARATAASAVDLYHLGRYAEAEGRLNQALAMQRELLGPDSPHLAETLTALTNVLLATARHAEAARAAEEARGIWTRLHGADNSHVLEMRSVLAAIALEQGHAAEAEEALREVLADRARLQQDDTAIDETRLGDAQRRNGKLQEALASERAALAHAIAIHGSTSWEAITAHRYLGLALAATGARAEARTELQAAISGYNGLVPGTVHPLAAAVQRELAQRPGSP